MERVEERNNMLAALKRVEQNGGAPGIDGIPTERLRDQIRAEWPRIRGELLAGTYKPKPVRRVEPLNQGDKNVSANDTFFVKVGQDKYTIYAVVTVSGCGINVYCVCQYKIDPPDNVKVIHQ
jgi:hypothetical protein